MSEEQGFSPGLDGVIAAKSTVGSIDGKAGVLAYRGYDIRVLAEKSTFEETCYLLLMGSLPTASELAAFDAELRGLRAIPAGVVSILEALPKDTHPMIALQTAVAAMGGFFPHMDVTRTAGNIASAKRLIASVGTITAAYDRIRKGKPVVTPDGELNHAANFLYMVNGERPVAQVARLFDACLVLHAEHGFNASTFTGRVVGSTLANPWSVVAGAIGSLSGPLHGGANEEVLKMLRTIPSADQAAAWLDDAIKTKKKIMGLGHREYEVKDPRATVLQAMAADLFASQGSTPLYDIAAALEVAAEVPLGKKGVYPNVDYYSGLVYEKLGIETDLFTPVFAVSRVSGWVSHWLEQLVGNKIFRPTQLYVGPVNQTYTDIASR